MIERPHPAGNLPRLREYLPVAVSLAAVLIFFVAGGITAFRNTNLLVADAGQVAHTHEVITALSDLLSMVRDAESAQNGFLITEDQRHLEPYLTGRSRFEGQVERIALLVRDNPAQQARLGPLRDNIAARFGEIEKTISLSRSQGFEAARQVVFSNAGRNEMEAVRTGILEMRAAEQELRRSRLADMSNARRSAVNSALLANLLGTLLACVMAAFIVRAIRLRKRQDWLQAGRLGLSAAMLGDQKIDQLAQSILGYLARYFDAHAAAFFVRRSGGFERVAAYGVPAGSNVPERFQLRDGLLGRAAEEGSPVVVSNIPEGYLTIGSALGQSKPRSLVISAASSNAIVNAVLEFGFLHPLPPFVLELLEQLSAPIAIAVNSANDRDRLQALLEETQRQTEELQTQGEELRVSNEELEEQSRALKESQARLQRQQTELEKTNSQLEEQTRLLEAQRNDLLEVKNALQTKAEEVERTSRYKSDFLANMSHELRTPLNSSLILAKLLADNAPGNLTPEQVEYARTIHASGNDLLNLINDILDLSKIEAGRLEVHAEPFEIAPLIADLERTFAPLAGQKALRFSTRFEPDCPERITTDRQRLDQVLKNLLSNAIKFTEQGSVELAASRPKAGLVAFAVRDTGIGIPEERQKDIFDAFRQADGTISRKYGGTGLGLSISRRLTDLLGGVLDLESAEGRGSTFTLTLAENGQSVSTPAPAATPGDRQPEVRTASSLPLVSDDREKLQENRRTILVVEDDRAFSEILCRVVRELDFQCLVAGTAEEALTLAARHLPSAVLLDVGLPDHSGLSVLDRLKRDARTRHIPVHVLSASDQMQKALSLGAVGYLLKPVERDEIVAALRKISSRLSGKQRRRVLIVEDDPVQRDSLTRLLGSTDVDVVAVGTAAECLARLKETTFDCMVLDLSLPDASGYSLLETLSHEGACSFPPVIVHTGRDVSQEEETRLRRYSNSIIIKGAKSPERLLDEVTLFLHQVVAELPQEKQRMLRQARNRDAILEGRRILVVEDDVRNVYSLTNILEPRGAVVTIARNGREAIAALEKAPAAEPIDLVLMDVMMPEMDGLTATRQIRQRPQWTKLPIIILTAKAMMSDQQRCLEAGASDYMAKPLDVERLLSLVRVWMPRR